MPTILASLTFARPGAETGLHLDRSAAPIDDAARSQRTQLAAVAGLYLVIVVTTTLLPFFSPLPLQPVVTSAYQGVRLVAWIVWLVAILVILARQPDNPLWKLMFAHMVRQPDLGRQLCGRVDDVEPIAHVCGSVDRDRRPSLAGVSIWPAS
jgi:hypothetical protein